MSNSSGEDPSTSGAEPSDSNQPGAERPEQGAEPTQPLGYWEQQAREAPGGYGQPGYGPAYGQPAPGQPPYGPPAYGQQPYGPMGAYPPPGYVPVKPKHDGATTALVLGIVGLVVCQLASPIAWWYGKKTMNEIEASGGQLDGYGEAKAGWICGIIGSVIIGVGLTLFLLFIVIAIVGVSAGVSSG